MATFEGVFFLIFGLGLLGVDYQSLSKGVLPCGASVSGPVHFSRSEQPVRFWMMFALYGALGLWLTVYALRLFTGHAAPLPLR